MRNHFGLDGGTMQPFPAINEVHKPFRLSRTWTKWSIQDWIGVTLVFVVVIFYSIKTWLDALFSEIE
jgi:hypothetical protein